MTDHLGTHWGRTALALAAAIVLIPVILYPIPPLLDYPNHVVRLWLLEGGVHAAPLDRIYAEDWRGIGTNIGIDLIAKAVPFVPAFTLGRILLALAMLLPPLGAVALNAAQFRKLEAWQAFFLYFGFAETALAGFLNFHIGLGLALFMAAADGVFRNVLARRVFRLAIAAILLIVHPFALLYYCALLAGLEFGPTFPAWTKAGLRPRLIRALEAGVCLVPLAVFLAFHTLPGDTGGDHHVTFNDPGTAVTMLFTALGSYNAIADILCALPLVALVVIALRKGWFRAHAGLILAAAALAAASPFMPKESYESGWLAHRLPIMTILAAMAATRLEIPGLRRQHWLAAGAVALIAVRATWIGWNWSTGEPMMDAVRAVSTSIPPGAAVLGVKHLAPKSKGVVGRLLARAVPYRHYTLLLVPWRHAFVPTLFAEPGKQPIRERPPYDAIALPVGGDLPSVHELVAPTKDMPDAYRSWRTTYDYVLVLNAEEPDRFGPFTPPPELTLVRDDGFAQLYKIRKPATHSPGRSARL